jgi:hypothetical protein
MHKKTSTITALTIATILTASALTLTMSNQAFAQGPRGFPGGLGGHLLGIDNNFGPIVNNFFSGHAGQEAHLGQSGNGYNYDIIDFASTSHIAQSAQPNTGQVLAGHNGQLLTKVITGVSHLGFGVAAITKFKAHKDNPCQCIVHIP